MFPNSESLSSKTRGRANLSARQPLSAVWVILHPSGQIPPGKEQQGWHCRELRAQFRNLVCREQLEGEKPCCIHSFRAGIEGRDSSLWNLVSPGCHLVRTSFSPGSSGLFAKFHSLLLQPQFPDRRFCTNTTSDIHFSHLPVQQEKAHTAG